jgi:hypothetical protein
MEAVETLMVQRDAPTRKYWKSNQLWKLTGTPPDFQFRRFPADVLDYSTGLSHWGK